MTWRAEAERLAVEHELKTWPEFFAAIRAGAKRHEVRRFDRDYRVGDVLVLREYEPGSDRYTGEVERVRITYMTQAFLPDGLVAMSVEQVAAVAPEGRPPEGWQPMETAPKDGRAVIGFDPSRESEWMDGVEFMRWIDGTWLDPATHRMRPTHWMPLPSPPGAAASPALASDEKEQP